MKGKVVFICMLFLSAKLFATGQRPDLIKMDGNTYALYSNPLESFFAENPTKRPQSGDQSTALWRGYIATFEIIDNKLYLVDIVIEKYNLKKKSSIYESVMISVFGSNDKVNLSWYTGILVIPIGDLIEYTHMGYGSIYEQYLLLKMEDGELQSKYEMTSDEYLKYKTKQFLEFKKTDEYKKQVKEFRKEGIFDKKEIDSFLFEYNIEFTSIILEEEF